MRLDGKGLKLYNALPAGKAYYTFQQAFILTVQDLARTTKTITLPAFTVTYSKVDGQTINVSIQ